MQPDSDFGARLVRRGVGELSGREIAEALESGGVCARRLLADGWIDGAALRLQGRMVVVAARTINDAPRANEIMVAVTDSGRPLPRVGGLTVAEVEDQDGLR